ncbi:MAG TPA: hypothetical protein VNX68_06530 [Nitrosopumilaceae archaeon]|jgi:hypothetical protein|nr:hypothetical protein [Nitrosopumilaceae archaeon]
MNNVKMNPVHISQVEVGDTVEYLGKLTTVNANHIKKDSFYGTTLFGDSYNLGTKTINKVMAWKK